MIQRVVITFGFIIYGYHCYCQTNLVPNPSFEELTDCPQIISNNYFHLAYPWFAAINTPDIFNICAGSMAGSFGVPINSTNCYQYPRSGDGYAGFANYYTISAVTEFPEVKLNEKLKKGKRYFISLYVNAANCSNPDICYSDGMALAFSDTAYTTVVQPADEVIPPFTPVVSNPSGNLLKDTLGWMEISGCYLAKGDEQYLIIGNFKTSAETHSEGCVGVTGSYYYLDDVGVYEFDILPDTILLCDNEAQKIGGRFLDAQYKWNTGSKDSTIMVADAGIYILDVILNTCTLSDTVVVIRADKPGSLQTSNAVLCKGEELKLKAPLPGSYLWNTGESGPSITINKEGSYEVEINNECGDYTATFHIDEQRCECEVFVPNVFSPNFDGVNDYLEPSVGCDFPYSNRYFRVFNRWGAEMYASKSKDFKDIRWDGTFKGSPVNPGVYVWILAYEYKNKETTVVKKISGSVTLVP